MTDKASQFQSLLGAFKLGLNVVERAGALPGVKSIPYAGTVIDAADAIERLIELGEDVAPNIQKFRDTFQPGDAGLPTAEAIAELQASIKEWSAVVDAPLPKKDDDEPE